MASERKLAVSKIHKVRIVKWCVKPGQDIRKDANIANYVFCDRVDSSCDFLTERKLKSRFDGKILKILFKRNVEIPAGTPVVTIEEEQCKHTVVMKEMCCECGADLRREAGIPGELAEPVAADISMVHNIPELRVSVEEAERIARYDEKKLLSAKKLALVVDLDQTLIHTTHETIPEDIKDVFHFRLPDQPFEYHTKARPGTKQFLEKLSNFYELHIFTMGSRLYAHTIARHLDPEEKLFAHRIRSRDECLDGFTKAQDLRTLFPCGDHMVCIIDDREDVWNFAPNLVTVKPYRYFTNTGDINDPFAKARNNEETKMTEKELVIDKDTLERIKGDKEENGTGESEDAVKQGASSSQETEGAKSSDDKLEKNENSDKGAEHLNDLDDYLYYLEEILERVHRTFYATLEQVKMKGGVAKNDPEIAKFCAPGSVNPDTRTIVPALRKETLKGANIVFTGVVPRNVPLMKSVPYRTAIELGANVTLNIIYDKNKEDAGLEEYSTHVVAARLGTEKAYRAGRLPHVKLVNPDWLWCCAQRWEWVEEMLFPVVNQDDENGIGTPEASGRGTPLHISNKKSKSHKGVSPVARDALLNNGLSAPDGMFDAMGPTFSKDELAEMDKEVEEYMLSDKEDEGDTDCFGSVSGSSRHSSRSSSRTGSSLSTNSSNSSGSSQHRRIGDDSPSNDSLASPFDSLTRRDDSPSYESFPRHNKRLKISNDSSNNYIVIDSSDGESSAESDGEDDIGALLERQINNPSPCL